MVRRRTVAKNKTPCKSLLEYLWNFFAADLPDLQPLTFATTRWTSCGPALLSTRLAAQLVAPVTSKSSTIHKSLPRTALESKSERKRKSFRASLDRIDRLFPANRRPPTRLRMRQTGQPKTSAIPSASLSEGSNPRTIFRPHHPGTGTKRFDLSPDAIPYPSSTTSSNARPKA